MRLLRAVHDKVLRVGGVSAAAWLLGGAVLVQAQADCKPAVESSPFIPVDSWIYPAVLRLYSLGYADTAFLGLRPWTRASVAHMLEETQERVQNDEGNSAVAEAQGIYDRLHRELSRAPGDGCPSGGATLSLESTYSAVRGISGTALRDSFHLGSTLVNDYGRPYENGVNSMTGISGYALWGRFSAYARGEFQSAPSGAGYAPALYQTLAGIDVTVNPRTGIAYPGQSTIPLGPIASVTQGRLLEAYVGVQLLHHVISFGKQDEWLGPAQGASMAYSNNAENIYALHLNRTEPLRVPLLSLLTGPFRYEFMVGELRGHTRMNNPNFNGSNYATQPNVVAPGNPWVHVEKLNFRPTRNLEFGFERTAIFGGRGHSPVNLHSFLKSFFSLSAPDMTVKDGPDDPGARFGSFDASYRLPLLRNWLTFYTDGQVHDDVSPIDAPRRASWRPGLYLAHMPGLAKLDLRVEGVLTDPSISNSQRGQFMDWEVIERQGYTNQGQLFGDWMGREDKGGQVWTTWHLSGNESVQASWRRQKAAKDFIPGGTTLNDFGLQVVKRIGCDLELDGQFHSVRWKAPVYAPGLENTTATTIQLTWFPERKVSF